MMIGDGAGIILIFGVVALIIIGRQFLAYRKNVKIQLKADILGGTFIILFAATVLLLMGRLPWCSCNEIWLWSGDIFSEHNSQHIFDPYTFTHFIHGVLFYALIWLFGKRLPFGLRLLLAVGIESAWEIIENTDAVIGYYRANTVSLGYYGDSVINSVSDILAMAVGFWFSYRFRVLASILALVTIEIFLAFWIKDNLTLNILMFIHPFEFIKNWQLRP